MDQCFANMYKCLYSIAVNILTHSGADLFNPPCVRNAVMNMLMKDVPAAHKHFGLQRETTYQWYSIHDIVVIASMFVLFIETLFFPFVHLYTLLKMN